MEHAAINRRESAPSGPVPRIFEAIVRRRCIAATYNRGAVLLAPHVLYTRHEVLHLDALTVLREGRAPRELKIATYRLSGLTDINLSAESFVPAPCFEPEAERYAGVALLAVEPD